MHGSAPATRASVRFTVQFADHGIQVPALSQVMGVGPMARVNVVASVERHHRSYSRGFLTDAQMGWALHQLVTVVPLDNLFFGMPNQVHQLVGLKIIKCQINTTAV